MAVNVHFLLVSHVPDIPRLDVSYDQFKQLGDAGGRKIICLSWRELAGFPLWNKAKPKIIDITRQCEYTHNQISPMIDRSGGFCSYSCSSERVLFIPNSYCFTEQLL
jgi:hypothetical protein